MTNDESELVEELLLSWHAYQDAYSLPLSGPRCSPTFREYRSGDQWLMPSERAALADQKIWKLQGEQVEACVDRLGWEHRAAIQTSMKNKRCGAMVWSNARLSQEESHTKYQEAKDLLLPLFVARGLVKLEMADFHEL